MAMGSAAEVEYHLLLARDLRMLEPQKYQDLTANVTEIKKMLTSLMKTLRNSH